MPAGGCPGPPVPGSCFWQPENEQWESRLFRGHAVPVRSVWGVEAQAPAERERRAFIQAMGEAARL
jgi:hypothetical protein